MGSSPRTVAERLSRIHVKLLWRRGLPRLKSETASGFAGRQSLRAKFFTTGNIENTGKHREKHGYRLLELTIHSPSVSSPAATTLLPPARQKCPAKLPETDAIR